MRLDDPAVVREEYASEERLAARKAAHASGEGPREIAFAAIAAAEPRPRIESRAAPGNLIFRSRDDAQRFIDATVIFAGYELPPFDGPFRVRRTPVVFVAHKT